MWYNRYKNIICSTWYIICNVYNTLYAITDIIYIIVYVYVYTVAERGLIVWK